MNADYSNNLPEMKIVKSGSFTHQDGFDVQWRIELTAGGAYWVTFFSGGEVLLQPDPVGSYSEAEVVLADCLNDC